MKLHAKQQIAMLAALSFTWLLTGCDPAQETETVSALQTALSTLTQNRSIAEQCVRDIQGTVDPSSPAYTDAMESYQEAREVYNRYLDAVESGQKSTNDRSLRSATPLAVQNATADFFVDSTRALEPNHHTRRLTYQRSVIVPENLQATIASIPKSARNKLVDQVDGQVRWRSWNQLAGR